MPRSLIAAAAGIVAAVGFVGFLAGFLGARDEPPPRGDATFPVALQGGAQAFGVVRSVGEELVIETDNGDEIRLPGSTPVLAAEPASLDAITPGSLVILALETDDYGGQAIRLAIVSDAGG